MKDHSHSYKEGRGSGMGHKSQSSTLPSERNPGQKSHLSIEQNCVPAPGSPVPTQAPKNAPGKNSRSTGY